MASKNDEYDISALESELKDLTINDSHHESSILNTSDDLDVSREYSAAGLKRSLHGSVFQLKLIMYFLIRGLNKGFSFRIASELTEAEKLDDVIIEYRKPDHEANQFLFLQAKHSQDEGKKISAVNLLNSTDGDFSLVKYFMSYRKIVKRTGVDKVKDIIIFTNIDFNYKKLNEAKIRIKKVKRDFFLQLNNESKNSSCYKFIVSEGHELLEKLKETSDLYNLVNEFSDHVINNKRMLLNSDEFIFYHGPLGKEVLEISGRKAVFFENFISGNNLSEEAKRFRQMYRYHVQLDEDNFSEMLRQVRLNVSVNFGTMFTEIDPMVENSDELSNKIANFIEEARVKNTLSVQISKAGNEGRVIKENLKKLAGHVFVKLNGIMKMSSKFLDLTVGLLPTLQSFRNDLKFALNSRNIEFSSLGDYEYQIHNFDVVASQNQLSVRSNLPDDVISDVEIQNFFDKLIFAVNQPDELELGDIIKSELRNDVRFNSLDIDMVYGFFQAEVLDWLKRKKSMFFTYKAANDFLDTIDQKINLNILLGISITFIEQIKSFDLKFDSENKHIVNFVNFSNQNKNFYINIVASDAVLLGTLMVHQIINKSIEYNKIDSYAFIKLNTFLIPNIKQRIMSALNVKALHLLVIEMNYLQDENVQNACKNLITLMRIDTTKKIIFISKSNDAIINSLKKYFLIKDILENKTPLDLVHSPENNLLKKSVIFNGKIMALNQLITSVKLISTSLLLEIIKTEEIKINTNSKEDCNVVETNDLKSCRLYKKVQIDPVIFDAVSLTDVIAVCGIDEMSFHKLYCKSNKMTTIGNIDSESKKTVLVYLEGQTVAEDFLMLCQRFKSNNVHLLCYRFRLFFWKATQGSVLNLMKFRKNHLIVNDSGYFNHNKCISSAHKFILISGTTGIGKTHFFNEIFINIKGSNSFLWRIRVSLCDYASIFDKELSLRDTNQQTFNSDDPNSGIFFVFDNFVQTVKTSSREFNFERELFFLNQRKIILFFDGFSELIPQHQNFTIELLLALKYSDVKKIFVSCRFDSIEMLEASLDVFSFRIGPIIEEGKQIHLVVTRWEKQLILQNGHKLLKQFAEALVKHFAILCDIKQTIFSIPLYAIMIADCFLDKLQEVDLFLESQIYTELQCREFPKTINICSVFKKLVESMFRYFIEKNNLRFINAIIMESMRVDYIKIHEKLAIVSLLNVRDTNAIFPKKIFKKIHRYATQSTGIIDYCTGDKPHFVHKSFRDYLSSKYFIRLVKEQRLNTRMSEFFLNKISVEPQYRGVKMFLSHELSIDDFKAKYLDANKPKTKSSRHVPIKHAKTLRQGCLVVKPFWRSQ